MQAYYGRNGECPMPIIASSTPSDCFDVAFEAARIAVQHMTPVILLSDGYIANGAEPWRYPQSADLPDITVAFKKISTKAKSNCCRISGMKNYPVPGPFREQQAWNTGSAD